jgi:hypothetical protein
MARYAGILVCFVALALATASAYLNARTISNYGWDYKSYEVAVATANTGEDPYVSQEGKLPFLYTPATLAALGLFTKLVTAATYPIVWLLFMGIIIFLVYDQQAALEPVPRESWSKALCIFTILTTGFSAFHYNMLTGNLEMMNAVFLAGTVWALAWKSSALSGISLAFCAAVKLLPCSFAGWGFTKEGRLRDRLRGFYWMLPLIGALLVIPALVNPERTLSYFQHVWLGLDRPAALAGDLQYSGSILGLFQSMGLGNFAPVLYGIWCVLVLMGFLWFRNRSDSDTAILCFWIVSVLVCWPRMMVYTYILAVIPLCPLILGLRESIRSIAIGIISVIPYAVIAIHSVLPALPLPSTATTQLASLVAAWCLILVATVQDRNNTTPKDLIRTVRLYLFGPAIAFIGCVLVLIGWRPSEHNPSFED